MLKQINHCRLNGGPCFLTALNIGILALLLFLTGQSTQAAEVNTASHSLITSLRPSQQAATGTLQVRVRNNANTPLPGINIYTLPYGGPYTTNANGECTSEPLNAGNYRVLVIDPNGNYATEWYNNSLTQGAATVVSITQGQTTTIQVTMDPAAHLEGQVSSGGTPLAGIQVRAILRVNNQWSGMRSTTTAANGHYNLGGLPAGTYRVEFSDPDNGNYVTEYYNNQYDENNANTISLTAGQTATANADLTSAGHIRGTVTNAQNTNLPAVNVTVGRYDNGQWQEHWAETQTDEQGRYDVGGLPAGTYRIGFADVDQIYVPEYYNDKADAAGADSINLTGGQTVTINVSLALTGRISGVITDQQGDPPQGYVSAEAYMFENGTWQLVSASLAEPDGTYIIERLLPGAYRVGFSSADYAPEYYNNALSIDNATNVVVTTGQTTSGINASLSPASHISGVVTNESNTPLSGVLVTAYQLRNGSWQSVGSATSSDGDYTIDGLLAGTYRVKFEDNAGIYLAEYYDNKSDLNTANNISAAAGQTVGQINAKLSIGASGVDNDLDGIDDTIEGNVPNASGTGKGDGNGDGTLDRSQGHVASLPNAGSVSAYVTLASPVGTMLKTVQITSTDPSNGNLPAGVTFLHGFFNYKITNVAANQTVTVTIRLHGGQLPSSYWKYGPTPNAQTNHWYEFSYDNASGTGAVINGNIITLYFKDGQRGDADLTVNGTITDPGGPVKVGASGNNTVYLPVVLK